jgi:hypothetical protein
MLKDLDPTNVDPFFEIAFTGNSPRKDLGRRRWISLYRRDIEI